MPQEPKRRHSRQRKGKRRASIRLESPSFVTCPNCSMPTKPHTVCKNCGYYKGKEVLAKKVKKEKEKETETA